MQRLRFVELALGTIYLGQIIQRCGGVQVVWSQHLLPDRQDSLIQWFRLVVLTLVTIELCQTVQKYDGLWMVWSQHLLMTVILLNSLAKLYCDQGKDDEAEPLY